MIPFEDKCLKFEIYCDDLHNPGEKTWHCDVVYHHKVYQAGYGKSPAEALYDGIDNVKGKIQAQNRGANNDEIKAFINQLIQRNTE